MLLQRLTHGDRVLARELFRLMAAVFEEPSEVLPDNYLDWLLGKPDFWAIVAIANNAVIGGLTAHTLPMTRNPSAEILLYDIAVRRDRQRTGVGRQLVAELRSLAADAGVRVLFVPADNEDTHALDFYHALGGVAAAVTIFTFGA